MIFPRRIRNKKQVLLLTLCIMGASSFQLKRSTTLTGRSTCQNTFIELGPASTGTSLNMATQSTGTTPPKSKMRKLEQDVVRLGRQGNTDKALDIYYRINQPTVRLMNSAIDACSRARPTRMKEAFYILEEGILEKNIKPNVFSFGALMNACNRARDSDRAISLLKKMQDKYSVEPNSVVYSSAISACARSKPPKPDVARELLREAVEDKKLQMSVVGFNAAISACAQAGEWKMAISILNRMENASSESTKSSFLVPTPDSVTYGTLLAACEKGEQWKLVLKYAEEMRDIGLVLDGLAVTSCLHACQQLGLANEAIDYLNMMRSLEPVAPQTAKLMRSGARKPLRGPDDVAYRLAISACARGNEWKKGVQLLNEYQNVTGVPADVVAYTSAITGCEYAGKWKEAFFLLDKMRKAGVQANEVTMAAVIGACATACSMEEKDADREGLPEPQRKAFQLLNVMKTEKSMVDPNIQVYNAAIRTCAEACDVKRAFRLLEEVKRSGIARTEITYGSLMTACERVGCVESASKAFRLMKEDGIVPNEIIYGAAISCCRKGKQAERALLLLRKMMKEDLSPNAATFNTVILSQTEGRSKKDIERAILVYRIMKSRFVEDSARPNRYTYNILVNFFASMQQPLTAETFIKRMRQDGFTPDVDLFTATVAAYERNGQPMKALNLMESMEEDGYDYYSVKVLNTAFTKALKLVNKVGQSFSTPVTEYEEPSLKLIEMDDNDEESIKFKGLDSS